MVRHGDLFDVLPTLEANSVDACVTDPPYGIGFMGKEWDSFTPGAEARRIVPNRAIDSDNPNLRGRTRGPASSPSAVAYDYSRPGLRGFQEWTERWAREVYRVLKPGAHLLVCGAPRSFHRMACGIEDAGFEVRDCFSWLFGQGFPKSLDISKAMDKTIGTQSQRFNVAGQGIGLNPRPELRSDHPDYKPHTPVSEGAKQWHGWGTALKPAWEPIIVARKPVQGSTTANVAQWGTGALNIDGCRITGATNPDNWGGRQLSDIGYHGNGRQGYQTQQNDLGRWPANVLLDYGAAKLLDEQSGDTSANYRIPPTLERGGTGNSYVLKGTKHAPQDYGDAGGASRFFLVCQPDCMLCEQPCRTTSASSAADRSRTIRQITVGTALPPAVVTLGEQLAHRAPSVEGLCERCVIHIAVALAEIKRSGSRSQALRVLPVSIPSYKSSTLIQSLASFAELWESTDTIPTTASLSLLFGSAVHAIGASTRSERSVVQANTECDQTRFRYSAKPSREERDYGTHGLIAKPRDDSRKEGNPGGDNPRNRGLQPRGNHHPTVKPIELMRWLVRLVTPPGGTVLDPFTGSGTTGMACAYELRSFIGIEREAEYVAIAQARIAACVPLFNEEPA